MASRNVKLKRVARQFKESQVNRNPAGSPGGGQFAPKGKSVLRNIAQKLADPLAGLEPENVLQPGSGEAKRFEKFLLSSADPEMLLEMTIPGNWSTSELQSKKKEAEKALSLFKELGISESGEAYDLADRLPDIFQGKLPPPKDRFLEPVFSTISESAKGFDDLRNYDTDPKVLAWEFATEYEGVRGLKDFRRDLQSDMAGETDPRARREYELQIGLLDRVVENFQSINKAAKNLGSVDSKLPDSFWEYENAKKAESYSRLYGSALNPNARKIGKILERAETEEAENAFEYYSSKVARS